MRTRLLIAIALALAVVLAFQMLTKAPQGQALAYTECPFRGIARVTLSAGVAAEDTLPVRMHEEVHARQCRELGPLKYRLFNVTARGKLALEAPAYCAGARARLAQRTDTAVVRERLLDDATAAFKGAADPLAVREALHLACTDILR